MTNRKPYLAAAGLWLVLVTVFFWPVFFQGKVLAPLDIMDSLLRPWASGGRIAVHNAFTYDAISQYLPYDWSVYQSLRQDGYIGWNPCVHSGSSIVGNTMACPGDWHHQLYRVLPFWSAWNAGIVIQFTIAGLGMLLLLRDRKIPAHCALIGVIAFGFYSQFTLWIYHRWVLGAMCWTPWVVWSLLRAGKGKRLIDLPSIAFIALAFRGGHLQACIFVVLLVALIALADWWQSPARWRLKPAFRVLLPYVLSGLFASILALDVFIETIPATLHGCREIPGRPWYANLMALPTLVTSVFPGMMGTPQGLDFMKAFGEGLFSIKFMGGLAMLLAALACFRRQAPLAAKVLFVGGLIVPFTPADQWLYSRVTAVFALGGAWLAAWYLATASNEPPAKVWKRAALVLALVAGVWLIGSVVIAVKEPWVRGKLHDVVLSNIPTNRVSRADWMLSRADVFVRESMVWAPRNLATLFLLGCGLFAASRIHRESRHAARHAMLLALCAFGEMVLFSNTWVTFSAKPDGGNLYAEPAWVSRLKQETDSGTILCHDRSDFDYMQLNTPSAYGIRFAEGYDTVTPRRIDPYCSTNHDSRRCAEAGISRLLAPPENDPGQLPGWEKVIDSKEFILYKNQSFASICTVDLVDGSKRSLDLKTESPNRREILLPSGVKSVSYLESFNPGWKYSINGGAWRPVRETDSHAMRIDLERPTDEETTRLQLRYYPAWQHGSYLVMGIAALGLASLHLVRTGSGRQLTSTSLS